MRNKYDHYYVVVGGGTIGLPSSLWLAESTTKNVLCIEAGSCTNVKKKYFGNTEIYGSNYKGANQGRCFGLGGTSVIWGGAMAPFLAKDCDNYGWSINSNNLKKYFYKVEELFNLPKKYNWLEEIFISKKSDYIGRYYLWPSFKNRNVYFALKKKIKKTCNLKILSNSVVTKIDSCKNKNIITIMQNKIEKKIVCKNLLICAGAIESTRLALLLKNKKNNQVGSGFSDHLSAPIGRIQSNDLDLLNKEFGFKFLKKGAMKCFRFEMSSLSNKRKKIPPHHLHIKFVKKKNTIKDGFYNLKLLLQTLQQGNLPTFNNIIGIMLNFQSIVKIIIWRFFKKILFRSENSFAEIHLVIQQNINFFNRIGLSKNERDQFKNLKPAINWKVTKFDKINILNAVKCFKNFWDKELKKKFGNLIIYNNKLIVKKFKKCGGIYHPASSLAFGKSKNFCLNKNLYFRDATNIQFISTASLPTSGGANSTMMALLLAARCVDQHSSKNF
jgi:hypothetical protein